MADEKEKRERKRSGNGDKPPGWKRPSNKDKFEWKKASRTLTFWILIILGSIVIFHLFSGQTRQEDEVSYSEFMIMVKNGGVEKGWVTDRVFHGTRRTTGVSQQFVSGGPRFFTVLPYVDESMIKLWDENGITYKFVEKSTNWFGYLLSSILPWIILIGIWILLMRRMQGGGPKGIFSFGKSRAKLLTENRPKITFKDVAGVDEAKEEVQEIIEFLRNPKKFQKLGGKIPHGALLLGPPGTGKTLLAKAIAGEAEVPFFSMSGADFVEMFVGVGASRVRDLFEQGKKNAPCIIFIDEIDAVGRHRGAGLGGGHDEREQTLNQLLVEMDGFDSNEGVILIAATNRPDVLDPALLRPGRFDRQIVVDRPDIRGRTGILKVHIKNIPLGKDVKLEIIAKGTPGLSGADLANIVNEAALVAAKRDAKRVQMQDFEAAKDKVMMGMERKSLIISDKEKKNTAFHEAGHVLVAKLTPGADPVHKVTIIPRGRALGLTHLIPIDDKHNYSKSYLEAMLTHLLGGRAAEKIVLKEYTTGAGNDIERATQIVRKMVCEWGMSDKLGPITYGKKEEEIFLGREIAKHRDYSESTAVEIDAEVRRIIEAAEKRAEDLIRKNLDKLHALANALLEREILDGREIDLLLQGKKLRPLRKPSAKKTRAQAKPYSAKSGPRQPDKGKKTLSDQARQTPSKYHSTRKSGAAKGGYAVKSKDAAEDKSKPSPNIHKSDSNIKNEQAKTRTPAKRTQTLKTDAAPRDKTTEKKVVHAPKKTLDMNILDINVKTQDKRQSDSKTGLEPKTPSHIRRAAAKKRAQTKGDGEKTNVKADSTKSNSNSTSEPNPKDKGKIN